MYAFCRLVDDAVDDGGAPRLAIDHWRERLRKMVRGTPANHPVDRALAQALEEDGIPEVALLALLEGMAWDAEGRRYDDLAQLFDYCARVASTVGVAMTALMGIRDRTVLARACDLGVAMQLTNIARDVGEDARRGRVYLPLAWFEQYKVDLPRFIAAPRPHRGVAQAVARLLREADQLYDRANTGIPSLPWRFRPAIRAASSIYREIGAVIREQDHDSVDERAVVSGRRKLALAISALLPASSGHLDPAAPLPATAFLVEAVAKFSS